MQYDIRPATGQLLLCTDSDTVNYELICCEPETVKWPAYFVHVAWNPPYEITQ